MKPPYDATRELAYYSAHRAEILQKHRGRFALIKGDELVGIYAKAKTAFYRGFDRFGAANYVVIHLLESADTVPVPFSVISDDDDRYPFEHTYDVPCPSCGIEDSLRDYKYYLMAEHKARGLMEAATSFWSPVNMATTALSAAKDVVGWFAGAPRKSCPQVICVACMAFFAVCPYCTTVNRMPGKIQYEHTPARCVSCGKAFDIFIYNDRQ